MLVGVGAGIGRSILALPGAPVGPVQTVAPVLSGAARVGQTIIVTRGTYDPRGGGTVQVNGEIWAGASLLSTGLTFDLTLAEHGSVVFYQELPEELGGTAPGIAIVPPVILGTVVHIAPTAQGAVPTQIWTENTGLQETDMLAYFDGEGLSYALQAPVTGFSINPERPEKLIADTDVLSVQTGLQAIVEASNDGSPPVATQIVTTDILAVSVGPVLAGLAYDSDTGELSLQSTAAGTLHLRVADMSTNDPAVVTGGGGQFSTTALISSGSNTLPVTFSGISQGGHFLQAVLIDGTSQVSNVEQIFEQFEDSTVAGVPAKITGLAVSPGNQQNSLAWNADADADDYIIEVSVAGGAYSVLATVADPTTAYVHTGLTNGTLYTYRVSGDNAQGTGPASDPVNGTPAAVAPSPTVVGVGAAAAGSGAISVTAPAHVADDIGMHFLQVRDNDAAPDLSGIGYTLLTNTNDAEGRLAVYWKRAANASDLDVAAGDPGNHWVGQTMVVRGCVTGSTPVAEISAPNGATGTAVSINAGTTTGANRLVIAAMIANLDSATDQVNGTWANGTLTGFTERILARTGTGSGGGVHAATGTLAAAGSTGASTATLGASQAWRGLHLEMIGG
ncbi:MAG: fibronectin type III domain-containing protein [Pseudomonadota bacterium]